jgi:hypothetical protein
MYKTIKSMYQKFKCFYKSSSENRVQIHVFLGFMILPAIGLISLFSYFFFFVI